MKGMLIPLLISFIIQQVTSVPYEVTEAGLKFELADKEWNLADQRKNNTSTVYFFKRQLIEDSDGRKIIPNIGVIIEEVDSNADVVAYSAQKRRSVSFKVLEVFTHESGNLGFENAIGYKGQYTDQRGLEHIVIVIHGINRNKGIQIICDATSSVFDLVEPEFIHTLKSVQTE